MLEFAWTSLCCARCGDRIWEVRCRMCVCVWLWIEVGILLTGLQTLSLCTQAPKKKKGMTHKVKNFLAGLPDLKHLYSKSVVTWEHIRHSHSVLNFSHFQVVFWIQAASHSFENKRLKWLETEDMVPYWHIRYGTRAALCIGFALAPVWHLLGTHRKFQM